MVPELQVEHVVTFMLFMKRSELKVFERPNLWEFTKVLEGWCEIHIHPQGAIKCYHQRRRSISVLDHRFHKSLSKLFTHPTRLAPWGFAQTQIAEFQHRETRYQLMLALEMSASFIRGALAFTSSSHGVKMNFPLFMEQNKGWLHTRCPICGVHFYKHQKNWSLGLDVLQVYHSKRILAWR